MELLLGADITVSLIRRQIELEYRLDDRERLVPFPGSEEQALYIVYRFNAGYLRWYRDDLGEAVISTLAESPAAWAFDRPERIQACLAEQIPSGHVQAMRFVSGYFPRCPDLTEFPDVIARPDKVFVIRREGQEVVWAFSVRENTQCAEVAVETTPVHRRRGYARQATAAWAHLVLSEGKLAFYSYKVDNIASKALAGSLGVIKFAEVASFE